MSELFSRLRTAWSARAPYERVTLGVLAALVAGTMYFWLLHSSSQARTRLDSSIAQLRKQAQQLDAQASEYNQLRAVPAAKVSSVDLRTLIQSRIADAGLARALVSIDAPDSNRVKVTFGALSFSEWMEWVAGLQAQQIRLDECRIEALTTPGIVGVIATFVRAGP